MGTSLGLTPARSQQTPELEGCSLQRRAGCGCEGNKPAPHPGDTEANKIQFLSLRHSPSKREADLEINYNLARQVAKQRGSPNGSEAQVSEKVESGKAAWTRRHLSWFCCKDQEFLRQQMLKGIPGGGNSRSKGDPGGEKLPAVLHKKQPKEG